MPLASHDPKIHGAPHFECLELTNAIRPLTMPSTSYGSNASTKCITDQKSHVAPNFHYVCQTNALAPLMMPLASRGTDGGANGIA